MFKKSKNSLKISTSMYKLFTLTVMSFKCKRPCFCFFFLFQKVCIKMQRQKMQYTNKDFNCTEIPNTSPTCEQLGIPIHMPGESTSPNFNSNTFNIKNESDKTVVSHTLFSLPSGKIYSMDGTTGPVNSEVGPSGDCYCFQEVPSPLATIIELGNVRKRNERERERVRCVNEGYARLRRHLPINDCDKRISKVETLRYAIAYINYLEKLLSDSDTAKSTETEA